MVLPCAAGDRDAVLEPHHLGQHLGAAHHRDAAPPSRLDLGVGLGHRRRDDHQVGALDVGRLVAGEDARAELRQPLGRFTRREVGARDRHVVVEQDLGQPGHAGAAHSHEVDAREAGEVAEHHRRATASATRSAIDSAARGRASERAARPMPPTTADRAAAPTSPPAPPSRPRPPPPRPRRRARAPSRFRSDAPPRARVGKHRRASRGADLRERHRSRPGQDEMARRHRARDVVEERHHLGVDRRSPRRPGAEPPPCREPA